MDREKIIEELEEHINGHCSSDLKRICHVSLMENILALLKEQDELIKVMKKGLDLVRCKDCKYLIDHPGFMNDGYCEKIKIKPDTEHIKPNKDFFCAFGLKKE